MRYVVTGATGFVGGALARRLLADGHEVVAVVRDPERAGGLAQAGARLAAGDVTDAASIRAALRDADGLFHMAGWYRLGAGDASVAWDVNVTGVSVVLGAARDTRTPKIVYTSTLAVSSDTGGRVVDESYRFTGRHLTLYDETKARGHQIAVRYAEEGLPLVVVQPGMVYGPGDTSGTGRLLAEVVAGRRPPVPAGSVLCVAHVDDIADGHVRAMERGVPGGAYFLAGPVLPLAEFLAQAADVAGMPGPRVLPAGAMRVAARLSRVLDSLPVLGPHRFEALRAATASYLGSPAKAQRDLGWQPRSAADGLAQTIPALRALRTSS